ncbi:MAG: phosphoribosylglycinamide formyltransferase [Melioribacteraceae bacterium]|nr:phosphoribosylglycinamide formyltransferase [Melioribacteraceae bacterium]
MFNIAVFVSGKGSNLKALFEKIDKEKIKIVAVVSNKKNCGAVEFANQNSIPVFFIAEVSNDEFIDYKTLAKKFFDLNINLIVLAGFLKKIPDEFIDLFNKKIINIHPALLPKFGGKGMYGMNVHKAVFESGEKVSGATVHFVDKIYDNGEIIEQEKVDISDCNSPDEIAHKVLEVEHILLPKVVNNFFKSLQ